jgi:hypothetical protein
MTLHDALSEQSGIYYYHPPAVVKIIIGRGIEILNWTRKKMPLNE